MIDLPVEDMYPHGVGKRGTSENVCEIVSNVRMRSAQFDPVERM